MSNPFAFFGLTPSLNIDAKSLRKLYLDIQRGAHPDLVSSDSDATVISEQANAHYRTLSNPLTLVKSFLDVVGNMQWNENQLPKDFLMEMMDLSDAIEEMNRADDASMNNVKQQLQVYFDALTVDFKHLSSQVDPNIDSLGIWYQKSQYLSRLRKNFEGIVEI
jgi:Fe-S protein assembly co-chaperone HscB